MEKYIILLLVNIIAWTIIILSLIICKKKIQTEKTKKLVYSISAILTVVIHYSSVVYHLIVNHKWEIEDNMYLPVYPCNVVMWLCLTIAFMLKHNKEKGQLFSIMAEYTFLFGTIAGFCGIGFNINFLNNPNLADFDISKGLLSHVTMLFCCIYLYTMNYVKINTIHNALSCICGVALFIVCGVYSNIMEDIIYHDNVNSMFMNHPPFEDYPFVNFGSVAFISFIIVMSLTTLYEIKHYKKEDVWFNVLKRKIKEKKNNA